MFATQTRHVFQPHYFKRLKINIPLFFRFSGTGGLHFYDNGSFYRFLLMGDLCFLWKKAGGRDIIILFRNRFNHADFAEDT